MGTMLRRIHRFPAGDLRHPPHTSAPKTWILVAIPPAVYCPLNEATLSSQTWIELSQRPTYRITFSLVVQAISLILILRAAGSWVNAVLSLEVWRKRVCVYRFNVTANRVLHLNPISRVLKRNPLNTILVLSDDEWSCCGNGTWSSVWVHAGASRRALVHARSRGALWCGRSRAHTCSLSLKLLLLLHLLARTSC
jgi:hypothetical protein